MQIFHDQGKGVNAVYSDMIWTIMQEGNEIGTAWHGAGIAPKVTRELHPASVILSNPRRRLVTSRVMNVTFALAEVLWILAGRNDVDMLKFYNSQIDQFSDDGIKFNAAYGHRMRVHFGRDQINDVVETLERDRNSRQATIVLSSPRADNWSVDTKDRACNVLAHLMIRDDKLDWMQIIRSNDAVWGTPYNWMQWTHIQEYIAHLLGVEVGAYHHIVDSLHIYEHHFDEANTIRHDDLYALLNRDHPEFKPYNLQTLSAMELDIRVGGNRFIAGSLPQCWQVAMGLFIAQALYKEHEDIKCMLMLKMVGYADPIYACAQTRFYWANRWHRGQTERDNITDMFGEAQAGWICAH